MISQGCLMSENLFAKRIWLVSGSCKVRN